MMFILMFSNFHLIIPSSLMEWWLNQKEPTNDTTLESTNAYTTRFNRKWIWFCRIRSVLQRQTRAENADQQCKVSTIRLWPSQDILLPTSLNKRCFFWLPSSFPVIYNPCNVPAMDLTTVMSPSTERKSDGQWVRKTKPTVFCLAVMDGVATMAAKAQWSMAILFWPI